MNAKQLRSFCQLDTAGEGLIKTAMNKLGLSARALRPDFKVARTIALIWEYTDIQAEHIAEAVNIVVWIGTDGWVKLCIFIAYEKEIKLSIGPAALVTAAFIGPGTLTLCILAGVQHGFSLLWAMLLSVLITIFIQNTTARIAWTTQKVWRIAV